MPLSLGHLVVAVLLSAGVHLTVREPCLGVHLERRERVGNTDAAAMSGSFAFDGSDCNTRTPILGAA